MEYSKTPVNIFVLLAYFYFYNLLTSTLVVDLLKEGAKRFTEMDVEIIYTTMKICGFKLRGDCPGDLKDLILLIKEKADSDAWK